MPAIRLIALTEQTHWQTLVVSALPSQLYLSTYIYRERSELFLGQNTLLSQEGTTQGDPLAMPFYALATRPLIDSLTQDFPDVKQIWYADDATAASKLSVLRKWWEKLLTIGPSFGYFVNPSKTWLVTKDGHVGLASEIFGDTSVNITTQGRPVLGSPVGKPDYILHFVTQKVGLKNLEIYPILLIANLMQPIVP